MPKLSNADKAAKVSATECRRRKEQALAEIRELQLAEKRAELIPAADVKNAWATVCRRIRDAVLRIPDKCAPAVAAAEDARGVRAILAAECDNVLRELSGELEGLEG